MQRLDASTVRVGVGESRMAVAPGTILASYGLGSCVGVALYDPVSRIGAMAHVMLPDSQQATPPFNRAKYADSALEDLVVEMERAGAKRKRIVAKIAGGAEMFSAAGLRSSNGNPILAAGRSIGIRNVEAVRRVLGTLQVTVAAADTGGAHGRTLKLDTTDGRVSISSLRHGEKAL
ncbi:MAG: chemotaxis protein CheD [Candidatus Geothermincolia bacterium]